MAGNAAELTKNVPKELLIDGNFVPAQSGKTFAIIDPRNEEVRRPEHQPGPGLPSVLLPWIPWDFWEALGLRKASRRGLCLNHATAAARSS